MELSQWNNMEHLRRNEPLHIDIRGRDPQTPGANKRSATEPDRVSRSNEQMAQIPIQKTASAQVRTRVENAPRIIWYPIPPPNRA
jgi:hypothetical protein